MKDMMIGVDLAKKLFQVHGALRTGEVQFRKKLTRAQFPVFMAQQEHCMVIFEACGRAHYWARGMEALGHEVKLIAPQYSLHASVPDHFPTENHLQNRVQYKLTCAAALAKWRGPFLAGGRGWVGQRETASHLSDSTAEGMIKLLSR